MFDSVLVWFRRDLRDNDHAALAEALRRARRVFCVFVFDREILDALPDEQDRRVEFIRESLVELDASLRRRGGGLIVRQARARDEIPRLARALGVTAVFANRDYEPAAKARDAAVSLDLQRTGIAFEAFTDQVVFDGAAVLTQAGDPFRVFTPYRNAWLRRLTDDDLAPFATEGATAGQLAVPTDNAACPSLRELGFRPTDLTERGIVAGMRGARERLDDFSGRMARYADQRDYPGIRGVSYLSVHLRFGTISIRELVTHAVAQVALRGNVGAATWLSELIWREFYFAILDRFPHVVGHAFKPEFDALRWETGALADDHFAAWCAGSTGYPLVDAAMRQLNTSGYMHNRLRMVAASFLTKDLGIDWRRGEAYFARRLLDFDLAANNGGWQWAASTGCDAQPYFRIFNPVSQSERFDPDGRFIRRYLPELAAVPARFIHAPWRMGASARAESRVDAAYPAPIVDHDTARQLTLARFAAVKGGAVSSRSR